MPSTHRPGTGRNAYATEYAGVAPTGRAKRQLQRAVPPAEVHVRRADLDAVLFRVSDDLGRGVEAHRLAVQQRRGEGGGVVPLEPRRDVDQQGEGRRVALGEAVL